MSARSPFSLIVKPLNRDENSVASPSWVFLSSNRITRTEGRREGGERNLGWEKMERKKELKEERRKRKKSRKKMKLLLY